MVVVRYSRSLLVAFLMFSADVAAVAVAAAESLEPV